VATLLLLSSLRSAGSPEPVVAAHLRARYAVMVGASYTGVLTGVTLIPFTASLRAFTHGRDCEAEWRWTVTLLSAAAAVALILVGSASLAAAAVLADQVADGPAVAALFAGAKTCLAFTLTMLGVVVLASARTLTSSRAPLRWLIRIGLEIGALAVASSVALFIRASWFGPGEPVIAGVGVLGALWVAATAVVMLLGEDRGRG
jgi:hypothetical protein